MVPAGTWVTHYLYISWFYSFWINSHSSYVLTPSSLFAGSCHRSLVVHGAHPILPYACNRYASWVIECIRYIKWNIFHSVIIWTFYEYKHHCFIQTHSRSCFVLCFRWLLGRHLSAMSPLFPMNFVHFVLVIKTFLSPFYFYYAHLFIVQTCFQAIQQRCTRRYERLYLIRWILSFLGLELWNLRLCVNWLLTICLRFIHMHYLDAGHPSLDVHYLWMIIL